MKKLTPRQHLFVHEYLVDLNATQAAVRAGYSKKTAKSQGQRLLTKVDIKKAVNIARERRINKAIMTREEILQELSIVGRFDLKDYQVIEEGGTIRIKRFEEMPPGTSRALASIEETRTIAETKDGKETSLVTDNIKIKGHDKLRALQLLGLNQGLFPNKVEGEVTLRVRHSVNELKKSMKEAEDDQG